MTMPTLRAKKVGKPCIAAPDPLGATTYVYDVSSKGYA